MISHGSVFFCFYLFLNNSNSVLRKMRSTLDVLEDGYNIDTSTCKRTRHIHAIGAICYVKKEKKMKSGV